MKTQSKVKRTATVIFSMAVIVSLLIASCGEIVCQEIVGVSKVEQSNLLMLDSYCSSYGSSLDYSLFEGDNTCPDRILYLDLEVYPVQLYNYYIDEICKLYNNLDPDLVRSVVWIESRYIPTAKNYNGTCIGLMQLSTKWHTSRANRLGVEDLWDPYGNILVGCDLLSELITTYDGNVANALMAYNMGCGGARNLISQGKISSYANDVLSRQQDLKEVYA